MGTELKDTLEECLTELYGLYHKYEKMNKSEAQQYSRALQKCESLLNTFENNEPDKKEENNLAGQKSDWGGDNRTITPQDRRSPGDRTRLQSAT